MGAMFRDRRDMAAALGDDYINTRNIPDMVSKLRPEGDVVPWQPNAADGNKRAVHIFTGKTVTQHALDRAMDNLDAIVGDTLSPEDAANIKEMLSGGREAQMTGGPMEELVIPKELADTLNEFRDKDAESRIDEIAQTLQGRWKQWTLFNPARFAKYYINNVTGDADALLATPAGKGVAKNIPRAFGEVRKMLKDRQLTGTLAEALEKGVIQSSLVMQEIQSMGPLAQAAFRPDADPNALLKPLKVAKDAGGKYFSAVQKFAQLRENAFRYAAYLHYKSEFAKGKTLLEMGYGASPPAMIDAISDPDDKAARMARDLMGDYGAISERAKQMRKRFIPFVSWIASNTTRYNGLFRNAYLMGRDTSKAKGVALGAYTAASLGVRMFALYGAVNLFNNMMFGDEEDQLGTEERIRLHVILGKWGDEILSMRFSGALSDYLAWFGMEDAGAVFAEVQAGRASYADILKEMVQAAPNKIGNSISPVFKLPLELVTGQKFYPDIFNARPIRDGMRHVGESFSMDYPIAEIQKMFGKSSPTRPLGRTAAGALLHGRDPGEIAYDTIRGKAFKYIAHETGSAGGFSGGGKSEALYNLRKSRRIGDKRSEELAKKALAQYKGGGTSFAKSIARARPLGMFPNKKLRYMFLRTLSPKEKSMLTRAQKWYHRDSGMRGS